MSVFEEKTETELLEMLLTKPSAASTTHILEALGKFGSFEVIETLLGHSQSTYSLIREGAVYGMEPHISKNKNVYARVREMSKTDPNERIRDISAEALENWAKMIETRVEEENH